MVPSPPTRPSGFTSVRTGLSPAPKTKKTPPGAPSGGQMLILSVGYSGTRFSSRQSTYRWFTGSPLSTTWVSRTANHRIIGSWPFAPASSRVAFPKAFIKTDTFEEACTEAVGP
jgi:hypothetical protein